jgi:hypothetical protein
MRTLVCPSYEVDIPPDILGQIDPTLSAQSLMRGFLTMKLPVAIQTEKIILYSNRY